MEKEIFSIIGLMSGTSIDGVDAAWLETDGVSHVKPKGAFFVEYPDELRAQIRAVFGKRERNADIERDITLFQSDVVKLALKQWNAKPQEIDYIGFHGQTTFHDPANKLTVQLGDGALMSAQTGIKTIYDFRTADVMAGGQGAPFLPLYHQAVVRENKITKPVALLNIGGVANVTWVGAEQDNLLAFDTGPGNALMDDFMQIKFNEKHDENGTRARKGEADEALLNKWLVHPYFNARPPKSLDRDAWDVLKDVMNIRAEDALATLARYTVDSIVMASEWFPEEASAWYVTGGGRHNGYLMRKLEEALGVDVHAVEKLGFDGDALEAQGFAYLAARSVLKLPLSFPTTTGCPTPVTGGKLAA
ncbi:MAG: anhydro-N-acetylmuramic acid kinase [Alphaproteobacteria bacterium]|nr:anhydro-N-acetylmuramic acid kinase [Alphaproteobacteria bacterium]